MTGQTDMTVEHFCDLYRHMRWADETVWEAIVAADACMTDERILDTMHHLHATQHSFLDVWRGGEFEYYRRNGVSAEEIQRWAGEFHMGAEEYLASIENADLGETIEIPRAKYMVKVLGRSPAPVTLGESIHQVASHSMHHRGQVTARTRELDAEPPNVDYIMWLWLERPDFDPVS